MMTTLYDFSVLTTDQQTQALSAYRGKVLLIVNTASYCGFTPQYRELQTLYEQFDAEQFAILAFPCNQFGKQEPNSNAEIVEFCQTQFHVTFPVFAKIAVNGKDAAPVYKFLKQQCKGILGTGCIKWNFTKFLKQQCKGILGTGCIKWNFTKFLIDKNGVPVKRYSPFATPLSLMDEIKRLL